MRKEKSEDSNEFWRNETKGKTAKLSDIYNYETVNSH